MESAHIPGIRCNTPPIVGIGIRQRPFRMRRQAGQQFSKHRPALHGLEQLERGDAWQVTSGSVVEGPHPMIDKVLIKVR